MKITMHVDDVLLKNVMSATGIRSKTGAVDFALRELNRRSSLRAMLEDNLGLSEEELVNAFDPGYDVVSLRVAETPPTPPTPADHGA